MKQPLHIALVCWLTASLTLTARAADVNFSREVRSILSDKCFTCHGPDEEQLQGGVRLDSRDLALAEADSGLRPIVPGNAQASELLKRVASDDPDLLMPPPDSGRKRLTPEEVAVLTAWIEQGADYQEHWAFIPPQRPEVPNPTPATAIEEKWLANPVDRFLLDRLQREQLSPSPEADRRTLIRRVSLDLIGLPPTLEQIDEYLNDQSSGAYERMVDRFLQSPHYGERMAIEWLDYARYADSNGFQSDGSRDIWAWRDWVINAFNRNQPFDQFTIEQLAGDMLENATRDQIIATGFNRNHRLNGEGGRIVEEWFVETVIDRVETTGLTWLGLTLNCCRCHDHKFDPISQREFYQLFAFFNSGDESGVLAPKGKNGENTPPLLELLTDEHRRQLDDYEQSIASEKLQLEQLNEQVPQLAAAWLQQQASERPATTSPVSDADLSDNRWQVLTPANAISTGGAKLHRQEDGSILVTGKNPAADNYELTIPLQPASSGPTHITGLLLEALPDSSLTDGSLGRSSNGNFVLTQFAAELRTALDQTSQPLEFSEIAADFSQANWPADSLLNPQKSPKSGWAVEGHNPERRQKRSLRLILKKPVEISGDSVLHIRLEHQSPYAQHSMGRFRLSLSNLPAEQLSLAETASSAGLSPQLLTLAQRDAQDWTAAEHAAVEQAFLESTDNPIRKAKAALKDTEAKLQDYRDRLPTTMVMREADQPKDAFVLIRGEYDRPSDKVERGLPAVLPPLPSGAPVNRLGLAQWIVSDTNPLTARVWVNRQWERFFGMGIVKTSENLGSQAEYPVHPELLDWLAVEFMRPESSSASQWDMKRLQRIILTSAAYRQSSHVDAELLERDPDNRLLARSPRFRLTGELVRDGALAASGLLVTQLGGPSVRPYMPAGVWDETSKYGNLRNYKADSGQGLYRRSMYTIWKRTAAPPTMLLFDAPNREVCTVKRSKTNTPLQALSLLNEVTFVEAARKLAERMLLEGGETATERLDYGFRLSLARSPTESEMRLLRDGLDRDRIAYQRAPEQASRLFEFGDSKTEEQDHAAEIAAYTLAANVILNLDEFVTRE